MIRKHLSYEPRLLSDWLPRLPDLDRTFLLLVVLISGTVTIPQAVSFGQTSGLGVWTTIIGAGVWVLWFVRPYYPKELSRVLAPLLLFSVYAVLSLIWGGVSVKALQNLAVSVGFTGFLLLSARECERRPAFAFTLHRALDIASLVAAVCYTITVLAYGQGADAFFGERPLFMARPFALFSAVAVARQLARWQAGDRKGFWLACWLVALVFLSQSRLCMVACLALFPLAMCCRGDSRSISNALCMAVAAAVLLGGTIYYSESMYRRFFGYDANLNVGGVAINSSGRAEMWQALLEDMEGSSVYVGHGAGGAGRLIDVYFPGLGHPHNDFLRFLYDFGVLGLGLWALFLLCIAFTLAAWVRRCTRIPRETGATGVVPRHRRRSKWQDHPDLPLHLAPLLALVAIIASMFTDNSVSYVFVMAPLGMLIGASLSRWRLGAETGALGLTPKPETPAVYLPMGLPGPRQMLFLPNWEADVPAGYLPGSPGGPSLYLPNWDADERPGAQLSLPHWEAEEPPEESAEPPEESAEPPEESAEPPALPGGVVRLALPAPEQPE